MTTQNQPLQEDSDIDDISWPLLSIYYDAAKDEDDEMVDRWRNDAKGIVIFTGLFSAAVAALLAVTVQDLKPNSQDTSAFYLGNIYQVLADQNATRASLLPLVLNPPPFSPPRSAIWVNSLWFLSLAMSLSCALWATSLQQWARRYLRRSQPTRLSAEKRARMRAFFAGGVDKMHIPWAVEGLPTLLHLSLFLFFGGLAIYLFNINHEVFSYVIWWIVLFFLVYGLITLLPIFRHDSTCYSPLSTPVWMLCTSMAFGTFKTLTFITFRFDGLEKVAEKTALEQPWEMYVRILDWTVSALETSHDGLLKKFLEAIPGFLKSELLKDPRHKETVESDTIESETAVSDATVTETPVSEELGEKLSNALDGFLDRTFSSNSASDSVKLRRIEISLETMNIIRDSDVSSILYNILSKYWDKLPHTLEMGQSLTPWGNSDNKVTSYYAQAIIAWILVIVQGRGVDWVSLAARTFGLPERDLSDNTDGDDSRLLAVFIHVTRQSLLRPDYSDWMVLEALSKLDIRKASPRLQHDFCTLWNEIVQEATTQGHSSIPVYILIRIRHLYIALHQGTKVAPTAFSADTSPFDPILLQPLSYPFCNLASHRSDSIGEIGATSRPPGITLPINLVPSNSRLTGAPPAAAAPQDITSAATLSHPPESSEHQGSSAERAPTPTQTLIPTPLPNTTSESHDAGAASNSSHFVPLSIPSSIPASHPSGGE